MSWQRVVNTTIAKYLRKEEVSMMRNRKITAMIDKKGRKSYGHGGTQLDWKVRIKRNTLTTTTDMQSHEASRVNRHTTATLDWAGYKIRELISEKEKLMNRNQEAIIKVWSNLAEWMKDDVKDGFADEFYKDGNSAGNDGISGIQTFTGNSGAASQGYVATPSDTYAGLSTTLAALGGSWNSSNWPIGTGSPEYDAWSPLIVDYTDTLWTAGSTWATNADEVLRFAIAHTNRNKSANGQLDMFITNPEMYRQLSQLMSVKERIQVNRGGESDLVSMGFKDVINIDGVDCTGEYSCPETLCFGWNFSQVELCCMYDQMFVNVGPTLDDDDDTWKMAVKFWGQMKFATPRDFVMLDNIT